MKILSEFYQGNVVLLSVLIGVFGSFVTLHVNERIASLRTEKKHAWILLASLSMGLTVWSVHFIGMLSFSLPIAVSYQTELVILSILPAIGTSIIACYMLHKSKQTPSIVIISGLVTGLGIVGMHYVGMAAMKVTAAISYEFSFVLLSVAIAFIVSYVSLYIFYSLYKENNRFYKLLASTLMGCGIAGMHYTSMKAADFCVPNGFITSPTAFHQPFPFTLFIFFAASLLFLFFLFVSILDQQAVMKIAYYDDLTGLPNRRKLQRIADLYLSKTNKNFMVVIIDIDNFTWVNETFGFINGNELIKAFAHRLEQLVIGKGTVGRIEGNKFTILLTEIYTEQQVIDKARNLLRKLSDSFIIENPPITVTASVGISFAPDHGDIFEQLNAAAEKALHFAKTNGKNQAVVYKPATHAHEKERQIAMSFREALQNNEFYLCYQPKYNVKQKKILSVEALIRWESPLFGFVPPSLFIPIAEKNGFIAELTEWILNEACRQMKEWSTNESPLAKVAVNISAQLFLSNALHRTVIDILKKHDLDSRYLELEITETSIMENLDTAVSVIERLKADRISIALDDFGTGVSSLTYLKKLPIHALKIDKSFIDDVHASTEGKALVQMIISLGKLFKLHVVAEGVESEEQLQTLVSLNCDEIQGYNISKPLKAAELDQLFLHSSSTKWRRTI